MGLWERFHYFRFAPRHFLNILQEIGEDTHLASPQLGGCGRADKPTWQRAAKDLHPQADAPVAEPGLRVDADVAGHHGHGQLVENGDLLLTVPFKYLFTQGEREGPLELCHQGTVSHSLPPQGLIKECQAAGDENRLRPGPGL